MIEPHIGAMLILLGIFIAFIVILFVSNWDYL